MAIELNLKYCEHARNGLKLENSRWEEKWLPMLPIVSTFAF